MDFEKKQRGRQVLHLNAYKEKDSAGNPVTVDVPLDGLDRLSLAWNRPTISIRRAHLQQHSKRRNASKPTNPQAISSAKSPAAAVSITTKSVDVAPPLELEEPVITGKVKSPPPRALETWWFATGLGASSSHDEEDQVDKKKKAVKPAPARKAKAKGKDKYLVSRATAGQEEEPQEFMSSDRDLDLLSSFDPFADDAAGATDEDYVHLRVQQRNGRKTLTTVQGLSARYNLAKVLRDLKKELCCNGTVVEDKELGKVIQLQGDHRKNVAGFLAKAGMVKKDSIKVHGF